MTFLPPSAQLAKHLDLPAEKRAELHDRLRDLYAAIHRGDEKLAADIARLAARVENEGTE